MGTPSLPASGRRCAGGPGCRSSAARPGHAGPWAPRAPKPVPYSGAPSSCLWSCCVAPPLSLVLLTHVVLQRDREAEENWGCSYIVKKPRIPHGGLSPVLPVGMAFYSHSVLPLRGRSWPLVSNAASQVVQVAENPPANAGDIRDTGSIPGLGRCSGGGHGHPLQYSCLENPHGQKSLAGYSPWGRKESDTMVVTWHAHTVSALGTQSQSCHLPSVP